MIAGTGGSLVGSVGCGTNWGVMDTSTGAAISYGSGSGSVMVLGYICAGGAGTGALLPAMRAHKCSMAANSSGGAVLVPWIAVDKCCVAFTILSSGKTVDVLIA